eukprot:EG_transcript_415
MPQTIHKLARQRATHHPPPYWDDDVNFIAVVQFFKTLADAPSLLAFVFCIFAPWRWNSISQTLCDDSVSWRLVPFANLAFAAMDVLAAVCVVPVACSWRAPELLQHQGQRDDLLVWRWPRQRRLLWMTLCLLLLTDVCFILCACVTLIGLVRAVPLVRKFKALPAKVRREQYNPWISWNDVCYRKMVLLELCHTVLSIVCLPFGAWLCISVYRIPALRQAWGAIDGSAKPHKHLRKLVACIQQSAWTVVDLPFMVLALLVLLSGWRAAALLADWKVIWTAAQERRQPLGFAPHKAVALHFVLLLRDVVLFPLFFILLATAYRLPNVLSRITNSCKRKPDPTPQVVVVSATVTFLPNNTWRIDVSGLKPADFVVKQVWLDVVGPEFWASVQSRMGRAVALLSRSMLPVALCPSHFSSTVLQPGQTEFEVTVHLQSKIKPSTISKKLALLDHAAPVELVLTYDDQTGTLFSIKTSVRELALLVEHGGGFQGVHDAEGGPALPEQPPAAPGPPCQRLCDVFHVVVAWEFAQLLLDALAVAAGGVLLLLFPWRAFWCLRRMTEPPDARAQRRLLSHLLVARERHQWVPDRCPRGTSHLWHVVQADINAVHRCSTLGPTPEALAHYTRQAKELIQQVAAEGHPAEYAALLEAGHDQVVRLTLPYACLTAGRLEGLPCVMEARPLWRVSHSIAFYDPKCFTSLLISPRQEDMEIKRDRRIRRSRKSRRIKWEAGLGYSVEQWVEDENTAEAQLRRWYDELCARIESLEAAAPLCGWRAGASDLDWPARRRLLYRGLLEAGLDLAAVAALAAAALPLYRVPTLVGSFSRAWDWRRCCFRGLWELGVDLWYVLKAVLVVALLQQAVPLLLDLSSERSIAGFRYVVDRYAQWMLDDLVQLLLLCTVWKGYRMLASTLLWAPLTPGELLAQLLMPPGGQPTVRVRVTHVVLILVGIGTLYAYPFLFAYLMSPIAYWPWLFGFLGVVGAPVIVAVISVAVYHRCDSIDAIPSNAIRLNWANYNVYVALLLEAAQMVALALVADLPLHPSLRHGWHLAGQYILLLFGDAWVPAQVPFGFFAAVAVCGVSYIVNALPVVLEDILETVDTGKVSRWPGWAFLLSVTGSTLFLPVVYNLLVVVVCQPWAEPLVSWYASDVPCWPTRHWPGRATALAAMLALAFYIPCVAMRSRKYPDSASSALDIKYHAGYSLAVTTTALLMALCSVLLRGRPLPLLGALTGLLGTLFGLGLALHAGGRVRVCSVADVFCWRLTTQALALWTFVVGLIAVCVNDPTAVWPMWLLVGGWGGLLLAGLLATRVFGRGQKQQLDVTADELAELLLQTCSQLDEAHALLVGWRPSSTAWKAAVRRTNDLLGLADRFVELEGAVSVWALSDLYLETRAAHFEEFRRVMDAYRWGHTDVRSASLDFSACLRRFTNGLDLQRWCPVAAPLPSGDPQRPEEEVAEEEEDQERGAERE